MFPSEVKNVPPIMDILLNNIIRLLRFHMSVCIEYIVAGRGGALNYFVYSELSAVDSNPWGSQDEC